MNEYQQQKAKQKEDFERILGEVANELNAGITYHNLGTSATLTCAADDTKDDKSRMDLFVVCYPNSGQDVRETRLEVSIDNMHDSAGQAFFDTKRVSLTVSLKRSPKAIAADLRRRAVNNEDWKAAQALLVSRVIESNETLATEEEFRTRLLKEVPGAHPSPSDKTSIYFDDIGSSVQQYRDTLYIRNLALSGDDAIEILRLIVKRKRERDERKEQEAA